MKLIKSALLSLSVIAAASAQAVTVFSPTEVEANCGCLVNQTVNLIGQVNPADYSIYLFGDELKDTPVSDITMADGLELGTYATVSVTESGLATNILTGETKQLLDDDKFFIALFDQATGGFVLDNGTADTIVDITKLNFIDAGQVIAVDVVQEVPVPAAAWLFGSAMLGLAGVKRRK